MKIHLIDGIYTDEYTDDGQVLQSSIHSYMW